MKIDVNINKVNAQRRQKAPKNCASSSDSKRIQRNIKMPTPTATTIKTVNNKFLLLLRLH